MTVEAVSGQLPQFTQVKYQTKDGENIVATKNNGVVTLQGDVNGVRQIPEEDFIKELAGSLPEVNLARTPDKDSVNFSGREQIQSENFEVKATTGKKWASGLTAWFRGPAAGAFSNGQWGKAIGYAVANGAVTLAGLAGAVGVAGNLIAKNPVLKAEVLQGVSEAATMLKGYGVKHVDGIVGAAKKLAKGKVAIPLAIAVGVAGLALRIGGTIDAVKSSNKTVYVVSK